MRSAPTRNRPVGSGPLEPTQATAELEAAEDRAQIFGLLLRAARSRASYAALLSVHQVGLRGQKAVGDEERFELEAISEFRLPRSAVPALEEVIATGFPYVGPIATGDAAVDQQLSFLGGEIPQSAMVLPLLVQNRTMALLVGHRGGEPLPKDEVSDLYPLLTASGRALERFVASRAGAVAPQPGRRASTAGIDGVTDENSALRRVIEIYREYESWEELADALRALVRSGMERGDPDEEEQLDLLLELGEVEADHLGRAELALEAWRSALTIDATDARVLDALERFFVARERWEELVDLLERRAALADELPARIGLLLNAAAFARDRLGDEERAVEIYERIVGWDPGHELAAARLNELYRARGQWDKLAALLVDRASREEDTRLHVAALEAAAEVYEDRMGDRGAAFLVWMAVLRREPERAGIVDALERLGPAAGAWDELLPECEGLAEELEQKSPAVAARLWLQIGRWNRDHLASPEAAADALDRALRLDPDEHDIAFELTALRRTVGPPAELASALRRSAELEIDPFVRAELYVELAAVLDGQLGQADEALAVLARAFHSDPASRPGAQALARLQRQRGDWDAVADILSRHAEALTDPPRAELAELHRELGEVLAEHLGRPDDAARAFKTALELDARNSGALRGLKHVYRATGQRDSYLEADEAELDADAAPDPARYADIAQEWEARDRLDRAAAAWEKLLALEPKNETAHRGLARVFRQLGRWVALAAACRSHLKVIGEGPERVPVLLDLAAVLETGLGDVEGAIRACQEVLTIEADNAVALDSLGRMYERIGRWNDALEALERCRGGNERERADLLQRMGRIHLSRGDATSAQAHLEEAIAVDPRNALAHEGLARLRVEQEDWALATHHFARAAQLGDSPADAVRCWLEAAGIYHQRSGDADKARDCLERALEIEPGNAAAREALAAVLSEVGRWEALWPHMADEVARIREDAEATAEQKREVYLRAARCAVEIENPEKALEILDLALALDPAHLGVLLARAEALFKSEQWEPAARAYNSILVQHQTGLDRSQSADLYRRLAVIQKQLGRAVQASAFYQKALELDPRHRATLEEMVELHLGREHHDEAIATLRILADAVDPADKPAIVERIGDLYADKLGNAGRAASTYLQVLELEPKNRRVLQKLLDVQSDAGQWKYALDTIARFVALEEEPQRRGRYILAAAAIRLERLQDVAGALEEYENALDAFFHGGAALDPTNRTRALEAFQHIDEILTRQKDWKRQERAYRKMVKRLAMDDPLLPVLWHGLGEIYRSRLKDVETAIVAFETAHQLDPAKNPERVKILGELYALAGRAAADDGGEDLVERAGKLVEADPTNPDAYRALGRACIDAGRLDEAWCVCRALVFLEQANQAEQELYRRHQEDERRKARGVLDDDLWALLRHPEEDRVVSAIFALVWEGPVALRAGPPKSFDLKESEKLKVEDSSRVMSKIFQNAARVLNAPLPRVYVQPERSGRLLLANCIEGKRLAPTIIVGRDLMTGFRDTEVAFAVASTMALLRPAYYLRLALPSVDELEAALGAAATVAGKQVSVRKEIAPAAGAFAAEMQKRLTPQAVDSLRELVGRLGRVDLVRWRNAVDVAARRAALIVCGELSAAASMLSSEPSAVGGPRAADKVRELVAFSVSPAYFAARRRLGLAIG